MKAVAYYQSLPADHPEALQDIQLADPTPGPHDLLVEVRAISVNPVDTKIRLGVKPENGAAKVLGWDATGIVKAVGSEVSLFQPGDRVFYAGAIDRAGANSELHLVDERIVGHMPNSLSFAEAAALPLTAITAWELLFERLQVGEGQASQGQSLLIVGAAGGVGSILTQLARHLTGLTVIGTASRPETQAWVRQLGAHHVQLDVRPDRRGDAALVHARRHTGFDDARARKNVGLRQNLADVGHGRVQLGHSEADAQAEHLVVPLEAEAADFVAQALDVTVSWFFQEGTQAKPGEAGLIVRKSTRKKFDFHGTGVHEEMLSPSLSGQILLIESTFAPGTGTGDRGRKRQGEEAGLVLSGVLELHLEGEKFILQEGDSFALPGEGTHRCFNSGSEPAVVLWISTPAAY